jgi:discoidin domain receptor family protein 2
MIFIYSFLFRLNSDTQGGAWCPREPVSQEKEDQYLEVDLGSTHVIAEVLTQGRFANGQGQEYAQAYRIHYWRPGLLEFKEYRDSMGKTVSCRSFITYKQGVTKRLRLSLLINRVLV